MIGINQRGQSSDLLQQLENETGVFQATSPTGKKYIIVANGGTFVCSSPSQSGQQSSQQGYGSSQSFQGQGTPSAGGQWSYVKTSELSQQQF